MSTTFDNTGTALTETREGCTQPAELTFACVNNFVHDPNTDFEDLQALCLGLASELDKQREQQP